MPKASRTKTFLKRFAVAALIGVPGFYAIANACIVKSASSRTYTSVDAVPHHRVGIVLGCAPTIRGVKNPFFESRMDTAAKLYHAGKVDRLLVSGDHGRIDYDEPTAMQQALVSRGVPIGVITRDFAGFRTLDTMVRAKKVFGVSDATVITDDFHLARSLYFADGAGIQADGVPSKSTRNPMTRSVEYREILARGLAILDLKVFHSQPKFLGKEEKIL